MARFKQVVTQHRPWRTKSRPLSPACSCSHAACGTTLLCAHSVRHSRQVRGIVAESWVNSPHLAHVAELREFLTCCQDRVDGRMDETRFVQTYRAWFTGQDLDAEVPCVVNEAELAAMFIDMNVTQHDQLVLSALMTNEHNRQCLSVHRRRSREASSECGSPSWLRAADKLFFMLDTAGTGHLSIDGGLACTRKRLS